LNEYLELPNPLSGGFTMSILCIAMMFGPVKHSIMSRIFLCSVYWRNIGSICISCILVSAFLSFTSYIIIIVACCDFPSAISLHLKNKKELYEYSSQIAYTSFEDVDVLWTFLTCLLNVLRIYYSWIYYSF